MLGNLTDKTYSATNIVTQYDERCFIEFNMNYATDILTPDVSVYGVTEPGFYKKLFPLESVVKGWRGGSGVYKPRLVSRGQTQTYGLRGTKGTRNNISAAGIPTSIAGEYTPAPRCYFASERMPFKYWDSPTRVDSSAFVSPWVEFVSPVWTNKIAVTFQNVMGHPSRFKIQYKTTAGTGGAWIDALDSSGSDYSMPVDGVVEVWRSAAVWTQTPTTHLVSDAILIRQIRILITKMSDAAIHPSIIEISPRVEVDVSDRLKSWTFDMNISEDTGVLPIGTVSSNSGNVTLSNNDGELEPGIGGGEVGLRLGDLMKRYCKVTVDIKAKTVGATWLPALTAFIDTAIPSGNKSLIDLTLFDEAKFLQEEPAPDICIQEVTPTAAIRALLDYTGHTNIIMKRVVDESEPVIRFFYSNPADDTVWSSIQGLCESYQYGVYIDEAGQIVIMTRNYIYESRLARYAFTTADYTYDTINYKANISDISDKINDPVNSVYVTFRPTDLSSAVDPDQDKATLKANQVAFSRMTTLELFRPNAPVLLGCTPAARSMDSSQTYMYILNTALRNAQWGQFSGYLMLDSEIMKFDGLEFAYTPKAGAPASPRIAKSPEELIEIEDYANGIVTFTGKVCNLERAQFGTVAAAHTLASTGWTNSSGVARQMDANGNGWLSIHDPKNSSNRIRYSSKILTTNGHWTNTRIIIDNLKKSRREAGGVIVSAGLSGLNLTGIYVQIDQSADTTKSGLGVYTVINNVIQPRAIASTSTALADAKAFDLSVYIRKGATSTSRVIYVYINRILVLTKAFTTSITLSDRSALVASGDSAVRFDYAVGGNALIDSQQSAFDGELRGYVNGMLKLDRGQNSIRALPDLASIGFERFDDYVREIYYEEVSFSRKPAISASIVLTSLTVRDNQNLKSIALGNEISGAMSMTTPTKAIIAIANTSSRPLLLVNVNSSGEATNYPFVYGNVIQEFEQIQIQRKDKASINKLGEKKVEFAPRWMTSRRNAEDIGDWILTRKKSGEQVIDVTVWAGSVVQLGDTVHIKSDEKNIDADFVCTAASKSGTEGSLATKFTLVKL